MNINKRTILTFLVIIFGLFLIKPPAVPIVNAANSDWTLTNPASWTVAGQATNRPVKFVNFNSKLLAISGGATTGVRVWQHANNSWSIIADNALGDKNNFYVWSATVFNGSIYIQTSGEGCYALASSCHFLWKSADGISWQSAAPANMGYSKNLFSQSSTLTVFNGKLFAGFSYISGGTVESYGFLSDLTGSNWTLTFSQSTYNFFATAAVVNGAIYVGTDGTGSTVSKIYKSTDGITWSSASTITPGGFANSSISLAGFNGKIYAGIGAIGSNSAIWSSADGVTWNKVTVSGFDFANYADNLVSAGQSLYILASNQTSGSQLWHSSDGTTWVADLINGMGVAGNTTISDVTVSNSLVYAAFYNNNGDQVYSTSVPANPTLEIKLPPSTLFTPKALLIGNQTYNFSGGSFTPVSQGKLTVNTSQNTIAGLPAYDIKITGFVKGNAIAVNNQTTTKVNNTISLIVQRANAQMPPPASTLFWLLKGPSSINYRMTFVNPSLTNATVVASSLRATPSKGSDDLFMSTKADCSDKDYVKGNYLCSRTAFSFVTPELPSVTKYLIQSVNALPPGITFNGNVAAGKTIGGFTFADPKSVAVGGTVTAIGGQALTGYQTATSKISWTNVQPKLQDIYNQGSKTGTKIAITSFGGANQTTWNLNSSSTSDPGSGNTSSFSSTPEGKLWVVDNGAKAGLTINVPAGGMTFNGRGTIVVSGDVSFTGTGKINCTNGDFGIIASGKITFSKDLGDVTCGAYVALGGDINMTEQITANQYWNVILIARDNVILPQVVTGNVAINYDSVFANNPTILFTDVLNIVFVSS